jgi:hypothetical protein
MNKVNLNDLEWGFNQDREIWVKINDTLLIIDRYKLGSIIESWDDIFEDE